MVKPMNLHHPEKTRHSPPLSELDTRKGRAKPKRGAMGFRINPGDRIRAEPRHSDEGEVSIKDGEKTQRAPGALSIQP